MPRKSDAQRLRDDPYIPVSAFDAVFLEHFAATERKRKRSRSPAGYQRRKVEERITAFDANQERRKALTRVERMADDGEELLLMLETVLRCLWSCNLIEDQRLAGLGVMRTSTFIVLPMALTTMILRINTESRSSGMGNLNPSIITSPT